MHWSEVAPLLLSTPYPQWLDGPTYNSPTYNGPTYNGPTYHGPTYESQAKCSAHGAHQGYETNT